MTSIDRGKELMDGLIGHITGFAVPQYVIATMLGKIPIARELVTPEGDGHRVTNYEGRSAHIDYF